ncbi:MAG: hypothetical protein IJ733_09965 [Lachnospiraceae bacterium]|nr:hypothetical protein [Lachnospiraceae bacterium]
MGRKSDEGISRLADVISGRITRQTEDNEISLDFGTILPNLNLQTDSFPIEIQKKDYSTLRCDGINHICHYDGAKHCEGHMHLKKGDRVLVIWVSDTPVIVGVIDK